MDAQTTQLFLMGLIVVLVVFALWKRYQSEGTINLKPSVLVDVVSQVRPVAFQLMELAQMSVNSVEQMRREGKITDNNVAFKRASEIARQWIPDEWEVSQSQLTETINAAILVASALSKQAGKSSEASASPKSS